MKKAEYKLKPLEQLAALLGLATGGLGIFESGHHIVGRGVAEVRAVDLEYRNPSSEEIRAAHLRIAEFYNARPRRWRHRSLDDSRAMHRKRRFDDAGRRTA
jgi:hypothetical protein